MYINPKYEGPTSNFTFMFFTFFLLPYREISISQPLAQERFFKLLFRSFFNSLEVDTIYMLIVLLMYSYDIMLCMFLAVCVLISSPEGVH